MGMLQPKPYKVFRNGEWVLITPPPVEYKGDDKLKSIQVTNNGIFKQFKKRKNK